MRTLRSKLLILFAVGMVAVICGILLSGCGAGRIAATAIPISGVKGSPLSPEGKYTPNYLGTITPHYWALPTSGTRTLTYRLHGAQSTIPLINMRETAIHGMSLWKIAYAPYLDLVETKDPNATPDIEFRYVRYEDIKIAYPAAPENIAGLTQIIWNGNNEIQSATIYVIRSLPPGTMLGCVAHETGHALGIEGHSASESDLMYHELRPITVLTQSDINTLRSILERRVDQDRGMKTSNKRVTTCITTIEELIHE